MITVRHNDQEIDIETIEDARWALEGVLNSIDDGARGLEGLAETLQDIVTEYEQTPSSIVNAMTNLTKLPATVMHMAAQFAHYDSCKKGITCIYLQHKDDGIRVASTNGHFAFRCLVPYGESCFMGDDELLLPAVAFKKKVNYAQKVIIGNGEARFIGGKKDAMEWLETRPCQESEWLFPSNFDSVWPDPASMNNAPAAPVTMMADYMRIICNTVSKFSDNGVVKMHLADFATSPMLLTASMDGLMLELLLMPVTVRA